MSFISENELELWAVGQIQELGFTYIRGDALSPEAANPEREAFHEALLLDRFKASLKRINPDLPAAALTEVFNKVRDMQFGGDLLAENRRIHDLMVRGVQVTYWEGSEEKNALAQIVDWKNLANEWLVVNQFEIVGKSARRPDIVIFLNGLPVVVIELKGTENGTLEGAFNQIETYKDQVPQLFQCNAFSVISEGVTARYGSISADLNRYMRWRTIDGGTIVNEASQLALETLIHGLLRQDVLLGIIQRFTVFEDEGKGPIKKIAGYHQYHAAQKGHRAVLKAAEGDGKGGVFWHTQGSGKSLLMAFFGGMLMHEPELSNPTLVVLTDRNDLDNQLFSTFGRCEALFGETPRQAESMEDLKTLLDRKVGGVIFTTIQKFRPPSGETFPELTDRSNVIVFADEAHRTQYGFDAKIDESGQTTYGFAHHLRNALPNATFVAFTGTPVELVGANTRSVFGDYIDVYDISRAVEDGATVPIYYEGRVVRIELDEDERDLLDDEFEDVTDDVEEDDAAAIGKKHSRLEALIGAEKRLDTVVSDILEHFDARLEAIDGKAMIVCISRRVCVEVYNRIVTARPEWHSDQDDLGAVKVVMTGSAADPQEFQPHIRSKSRQETLRTRYRSPSDPLKLVIVRDMWLTGFDAPSMHTLYVDKPMKGHGLMQAIARVNRVFKDKPAGLVVDYIGLAADLKKALSHYSDGDRSKTGVDEREAVEALSNALDVLRTMFHGIDYQSAINGTAADRLRVLPQALQHVLTLEKNPVSDLSAEDASKKRFLDAAAQMVKAFKLASGTKEAKSVAEEVGFFAAIQAAVRKLDASGRTGKTKADADLAIEQLVNRAVASTEVIDLLAAAGVEAPDMSILSEEFLAEMQQMKHKNLAVEALRKLLNGEISSRTRTNVVKREEFSKLLEDAIGRYHNRSVDALQVIQELIEIAKSLRDQPEDGLSDEERAFYDALAQNESAIEVLGNDQLQIIAAELVKTVRSKSGVDWWNRRDVRAQMRIAVKRLLRKYGFPPDLQADAVKVVIKQAEAMARAA